VSLHSDIPEPTVLSREQETDEERWVHSDRRTLSSEAIEWAILGEPVPLVDVRDSGSASLAALRWVRALGYGNCNTLITVGLAENLRPQFAFPT